jgi:hypothetical protein
MTKICAQCSVEKSLDEFHRSKIFNDGRTSKCKKCKSLLCSDYYVRNVDLCKKKSANYYQDNKDGRNLWEKNKSLSDPLFKLKKRLRHRLRSAFYRLKKSKSSGSAIKDLGCSIDFLKQHLESQFEPGMTWDNWSTHGWHIDHREPLANASTQEELLRLCHYANLQPLWAKDNLSKSNKVQ